jgi:hypothetical protein
VAAPPVSSAIQILPDIFDLKRITPDQARDNMLSKITYNRKLAPVEGSISKAIDALVGFYLQGSEVSSWRTYIDRSSCDLHARIPRSGVNLQLLMRTGFRHGVA